MNAGSTMQAAHILLVEDSETRALQLRDDLEASGFSVSWRSTAETLHLARSASATWDCVLVHLHSTGFDGIEFCRQLNAYRSLAPMPDMELPSFAIICVGRADDGDMLAQAFAAGADDVVSSNAEADVMRVRICALIRRKLMQDENRRIEAARREQALALARARAEAESTEALARATRELEEANHRLQGTQAQLVQAAKMASLGELVAGIAHEINNPLAFILAHQRTVEKLLDEIAAKLISDAGLKRQISKSRERVGAMKLGLTRIQELVLNLRRFSRLDEGDFQTINVPESVETVLALLGQKLGSRIDVRRRYEAAPELYCSPALLNQVVMNIVGNAADAIKGTGAIDIETASDETTYSIRISDTGPGIPPDLRERIFEPFFTTKPVGSGTGLGLAIAYNVVQAHRGSLTVEAAPSGGASFIIRIPRQNVQ